jgi:hypothetical protein
LLLFSQFHRFSHSDKLLHEIPCRFTIQNNSDEPDELSSLFVGNNVDVIIDENKKELPSGIPLLIWMLCNSPEIAKTEVDDNGLKRNFLLCFRSSFFEDPIQIASTKSTIGTHMASGNTKLPASL